MGNDKLNKMLAKAENASNKTADLSFKGQTVKNEPPKEKRSVHVKSNLTPTEKKDFLALIGRKSESNVIREMVLKFIKKGESI